METVLTRSKGYGLSCLFVVSFVELKGTVNLKVKMQLLSTQPYADGELGDVVF